MDDWQLPFDFAAYEQFENVARHAGRDDELGGKAMWLGSVVWALRGFECRIYGARVHYFLAHTYQAVDVQPIDFICSSAAVAAAR